MIPQPSSMRQNRMEVSGLIDTLEKINDQLDEAEQVLLEKIYDDDELD